MHLICYVFVTPHGETSLKTDVPNSQFPNTEKERQESLTPSPTLLTVVYYFLYAASIHLLYLFILLYFNFPLGYNLREINTTQANHNLHFYFKIDIICHSYLMFFILASNKVCYNGSNKFQPKAASTNKK